MARLLTAAEQTFVTTHLTHDVRALALQTARRTDIDGPVVVAQIQARQKARSKLPNWYANPALLFPPPLSVEQASSEATAAYKASLVGGSTLLDLTGGMGVDAAAFAAQMAHVTYLEQQPAVAAATAYNLTQLGLTNVDAQVGDGLAYLGNVPERADWLYLDPARRDDRGGRVVGLADCDPDVLTYLPLLLEKGRNVLIKTSPLLDIEATLRQLPTCRAVHVVALQGEVKELLFVLDQIQIERPASAVGLVAVDLRHDGPVTFSFERIEEANATVSLADFGTGLPTHLYEPNAAVLKAGAFRLVGERFGLAKLAPHSHLYTGDKLVGDFPGRVFQIEAICKADRKTLLTYVPGGRANLTVRNFPQSVDMLRKQLNLLEGGEIYVFATTLPTNDKRLIITRKALL
ncbi:SAM-dependent methyltransferase [Fibrella sp. WM1]|uniref:THUMP-like domain-containing protein n=1 Tax=Fibrella musci TaxID=3242485 RepID=UPI0035220BEF